MSHDIYLDANATCAALPAAIDAALDALGGRFGNPSSSHAAGIRARAILDDARACARRVTGAGEGRLMFTSGATEGIQAAALSVLWSVRERQLAGEPCGRLLVYGATEHKAVPESLAHWNRLLGTGLELVALPVDGEGRHRLDVLRELAPDAAMVCTMAANNETGVISDIDAIGAVLEQTGSGARWMVDCVQALGKLPLALSSTRIDYAPFSGHKLCAPKGIGMLYVREGSPFTPLIMGGGQEDGQRSGTENMAGIAAFGAVLKALEEGATFRGHDVLLAYRDRIVDALRAAFPEVVFNAPLEHALPTTINFSVPRLAGRELLDVFDAAGVRVSAGSACSASKAQPSYVLQAMDIPLWRAASAVRLSFGPHVDDAFIDAACERIRRCGMAIQAAPTVLSPEAGQVPADAGCGIEEADMHLSPDALGDFLHAHPDAVVVDVREPAEHAVAKVVLHGREVRNVPLSRLVEQASRWLHGERCPLVFVCRSGNRSARAARYLRRIGYAQAWHMSGGLALAG
jgi:cysteine sulfinate desulfinase/cysteine desulfurase-like protein/rhodanese-related sulfurtransferase